ncbi:hypothetical protein [Anaplasma phagocytophilum]|uniref:hypothetical protein n=1 Tax=Anaplasma phagocytophilum TaxID=948 RepID=UPI001E2E7467|nr:hypothetical protein [Anaplasma phagocytophilum]
MFRCQEDVLLRGLVGCILKLLYHAVVYIVYCRNVELYGFHMSLPCVAIRDKWRYTGHISDY